MPLVFVERICNHLKVTDPRVNRGANYPLLEMVFVALCGAICDCNSWVDVASLVGLRRGGALAPFPEAPIQTGRADFPHPAYRWFSHAACVAPGCRHSRPPADRHSARIGYTAWNDCSC